MNFDYKLNGIDFVSINKETLINIHQGGVSCYYPWKDIPTPKKIKYVMMDLDGTSVISEEFWVYLIEKTTARMLNKEDFRLSKDDAPFVSGFSTEEHLSYTRKKYGYKGSVLEALNLYHQLTNEELSLIMEGKGKRDAFAPRKGLKEFLLALKEKEIKIGLATSGLNYKALPEIIAAFKELNLGSPLDFYDSIITGGERKIKGKIGTIGELAAKPHPWIYEELALGLGVKDKREAIVIEDSSAGVISAKCALFPVIGFKDGNIYEAKLDKDCYKMVDSFEEIIALL